MATMHNRMTWEPTGLLGSMKHRDRARLRIAFVIFATAFLTAVTTVHVLQTPKLAAQVEEWAPDFVRDFIHKKAASSESAGEGTFDYASADLSAAANAVATFNQASAAASMARSNRGRNDRIGGSLSSTLDAAEHAASARAVVAQSLSRRDEASGTDHARSREQNALTDRAALTVLYYATNGANWQRNDKWLSEKPLNTWHGVSTDRHGRVTRIDLNDNQLVGTLPSELEVLTKLTDLLVDHNSLGGVLPSELGALSMLAKLNLSYNSLSGVLPPSLCDLKKLKKLMVSHNRLSGHLPLCLGDMHQSLRLDFKGNPDFDGLTVSSVSELKRVENRKAQRRQDRNSDRNQRASAPSTSSTGSSSSSQRYSDAAATASAATAADEKEGESAQVSRSQARRDARRAERLFSFRADAATAQQQQSPRQEGLNGKSARKDGDEEEEDEEEDEEDDTGRERKKMNEKGLRHDEEEETGSDQEDEGNSRSQEKQKSPSSSLERQRMRQRVRQRVRDRQRGRDETRR